MGGRLESLGLPPGVEVSRHAPVDVDGVPVEATLLPADAEALAQTLRVLGEAGCAALPRGAGSQLGFGNAPERADAFLSLELLSGIDTLDASEGVCHAGAGTPLVELRARAEAAGWELPLDDVGRGGSLGGALATATPGPRAQSFGLPRDVVLGLDVALSDGSLTHCGGRVVKNVTGYDLAKLYLGSLGSLGAIAGAWLRLRPRPEMQAVFSGGALDDRAACQWAIEWARRPALRSIFLADTRQGLVPWIELAGDAASVESSAAQLQRDGLRAVEVEARTAAEERSFARGGGESQFCVSSLLGRLEACVAALREARAELVLLPALNRISARFGAERTAEECFDSSERAAAAGGGRWLCEAAPPAFKMGRDVFGAPAGEAALAAKLKAQFDPAGVLNPGRHAGRV